MKIVHDSMEQVTSQTEAELQRQEGAGQPGEKLGLESRSHGSIGPIKPG